MHGEPPTAIPHQNKKMACLAREGLPLNTLVRTLADASARSDRHRKHVAQIDTSEAATVANVRLLTKRPRQYSTRYDRRRAGLRELFTKTESLVNSMVEDLEPARQALESAVLVVEELMLTGHVREEAAAARRREIVEAAAVKLRQLEDSRRADVSEQERLGKASAWATVGKALLPVVRSSMVGR